ncbi:MAG: DUF2007 domain-containing protein [Paramuribaculum sp.]|nr:DUF2007 domain-containing protein [Paramuribaculum sp.]
MKQESGDDLVTLAEYAHDWQAHIAKGILDDAGIPSIINNELFNSLYPIGFSPFCAITVSVRRKDLEEARRLTAHCSDSGD